MIDKNKKNSQYYSMIAENKSKLEKNIKVVQKVEIDLKTIYKYFED